MPKGTRVHSCVEKLKNKKGINAYAVCQAATGQSYATGKPLRGNPGGHIMPAHMGELRKR